MLDKRLQIWKDCR